VLFSEGRFALQNFCLKLSHATCLQLELYCVNQAHNSPRTSLHGQFLPRFLLLENLHILQKEKIAAKIARVNGPLKLSLSHTSSRGIGFTMTIFNLLSSPYMTDDLSTLLLFNLGPRTPISNLPSTLTADTAGWSALAELFVLM
jgi:hypothetical protein